jgi:hypothetical protein
VNIFFLFLVGFKRGGGPPRALFRMDDLALLERARASPLGARAAAHIGALFGSPGVPLDALGPPPAVWVDRSAALAPASIALTEWRVRRIGSETYARMTLAEACSSALWSAASYDWRGYWRADEAIMVCVAVAQYDECAAPIEAVLLRKASAPLGVRWAGVHGSEFFFPDLDELHPMHPAQQQPPTLERALRELARDPESMHAHRLRFLARDARLACFLLHDHGAGFASARCVQSRAHAALFF